MKTNSDEVSNPVRRKRRWGLLTLFIIAAVFCAWFFGPSKLTEWNTGTGEKRVVHRFFGFKYRNAVTGDMPRIGNWVDKNAGRGEKWVMVSRYGWRQRGTLISWHYTRLMNNWLPLENALDLLEANKEIEDARPFKTRLSHLALDRVAQDDSTIIAGKILGRMIDEEVIPFFEDDPDLPLTHQGLERDWRRIESTI